MTTVELTKGRLKVLYWRQKKTLTEIAEMFGVTHARIWAMMERWDIPRRNPGPTGKGTLTERQVRRIKTALKAGQTGGELADKYGVTRQTIHQIKKGKIWRHVN